jgi:hypothetical protein
VQEAALLGSEERLPATNDGGSVEITLPERVPVSAAYALRPGRGVRPIA